MNLPISDPDNLVGCIITMGWGGPNIYIDTSTRYVEGYWWTEEWKTSISEEVCDMIDDMVRDLLVS